MGRNDFVYATGQTNANAKSPFTVKKIIEETPDTWTMVLEPKGHEGLISTLRRLPGSMSSSLLSLHRNPFSISGSAHKKNELRFSIKTLVISPLKSEN